MVERQATIRNAQGIHCRPSAEIIKVVESYGGQVTVGSPEGDCDPRSILALMALGLEQGTPITISVEGDNEEEMADALVELFERHFDFPPREAEAAGEFPPLNSTRNRKDG